MTGTRPPFIYEPVQEDERFPRQSFDPKAVTRASYESKPRKPKRKGPLIAVNRHPDAHVVPTGRTNWMTMGYKTKSWIKWSRIVQLGLRILELIAAVGLLVLMILITNVEALTGWVLRITLGVTILHCLYAIYHLSKPANGRTPGTSSAYHVFAGISDICVMPLYAYGVLSARNQAANQPNAQWKTLLADQSKITYFVPALYYGLITAGGLHLVSLAISLWLGVMFRRIHMMPPDMNPLEGHLTSRAHKRNKSSIATSVYAQSEKRLATPAERHPATVDDGDLSQRRTIAFMHTRDGSAPGSRDSRLDLPSRQYQIVAGNSPHNSTTDLNPKRVSGPPRSAPRGGVYTEVLLHDGASGKSRPESSYSYRPPPGTVPAYLAEAIATGNTPPPVRAAKFTEAWYASESLVNRTQERERALHQLNGKRSTYESLNQRYDISPDSDSDNDYERDDHSYSNVGPTDAGHPNPLRSHPTASPPSVYSEYVPGPESAAEPPQPPSQRRPKTPFARVRNSVLSAISLNDRRVSGSQDITEEKWQGRNRDSSIQADSAFYSKPYGDLRPATPPVMIGGNGRQVSSGHDYDLGSGSGVRGRHVSGKIAEEGRAGGGSRFSRYEAVDE